ncbi:MAG: hypothetical protein QOJ39_2292 [Candidatus Eremiobacteraeota bacterium]|jgi:serine phosphatase RsbU (regulator of sigma subunit)/DNA-binding response OmpR family regulator|nr:hypothetical protein [Candidatus Eremiobacteraeota bacterium]
MSSVSAALAQRLLVVDDSESNRYVLATWLRRAGYDVREARSGRAALDAFDVEPFDLVVLDVNLPDIGGHDVCEAIKSARPNVPVLHVSATATQPSDRSEGLRRGADGYLVEPVEREELVATVEALLRGAAAQRTALRLARRLRRLNEATLALNEAADVDALVATTALEASALFDAVASVGLVLDDTARIAVAAGGDTVLEVCSPGAVDALRAAAARDGALYAALDAPDGQRGTIHIAHGAARSDEDDVVLAQYARAANVALRNVRSLQIERQIALMLQRNLLPDEIPDLATLQVATRYEASAEHAEVGGDFYEVFALDDDHVAIAIGDVVGHSLEAAMVMAQLRTALRSYFLEGHGPAATLDRLNRLLCRFHPGMTATACCMVYDGRDGSCELANAGHLPPLIVAANGDARYLPFGDTLLGVEADPPRPYAFTLHSQDLMLLFTDGLVERRDVPLDETLARLAAIAAQPASGMDELCDRIIREVGPATARDDIALMAIRPFA